MTKKTGHSSDFATSMANSLLDEPRPRAADRSHYELDDDDSEVGPDEAALAAIHDRIVPGDYVAVHADTMVGLAAAMACIEAERHEAVAAHADLMAEFHAAIERAVEYRMERWRSEQSNPAPAAGAPPEPVACPRGVHGLVCDCDGVRRMVVPR